MSQTIKLKRSAVAGRIPSTSDLELGEVAINTYDGKMYIKKTVNGVDSIVEIGANSFSGTAFTQYTYTATANQSVFTGADNSGSTLDVVDEFSNVFMNGVLLDPDVDFTVSSDGLTLTLTTPAAAGDIIQINSFDQAVFNGTLDVDQLIASGITYPTTDGTNRQVLMTDGSGTLSFEDLNTIHTACVNQTGSTLLKGTPVYQTGTSGNTMIVAPADASSASTMPAVGVLEQDLADQAEGFIIHLGQISGVDTSAFSEGDTIYVAVGGGFTNVPPTGEGNLLQNLGQVTKVHATNGGGVVMGAGRSNATPNLNDGNIFIGNSSNQAVTNSFYNVLEATTGYNNSNWDTAYGWGDHSTQNYAVTTGDTFTGTVNINGGELNIGTEGRKITFQTSSSVVNELYSGDSFTTNGFEIHTPNGVTFAINENDNTAGSFTVLEGSSYTQLLDVNLSGDLTVLGSTFTGKSLTLGTGGNYSAGSIYSDSNWGMLFRAKQANPNNAQYRWATSTDSELMRIDNNGILKTSGDIQIDSAWGGTYPEQLSVIGDYASMCLRNQVGNFKYLFHTSGSSLELYSGSGWSNTSWSRKIEIDSTGNFDIKAGALKIGTTTVIDSARNLLNISSLKSTGSITITPNTGDSVYKTLILEESEAYGNGTVVLRPGTTPGSGTANQTLHIKSNVATGTTQHHLRVDGNITSSKELQVESTSSGNNQVMKLCGSAQNAGEYTSILLHSTNFAGEWYGSEIRTVNEGSNPGYLQPKLSFFTQNYNTYLPADRTEKLSIKGNGNVTAHAGNIITLSGFFRAENVGADKKFQWIRTGGNTFSLEHDTSGFYFYNETTTDIQLRFLNNGYIGNHASPQRPLHIVGNDGSTSGSSGNSDTAILIENAGGNGAILEFLASANEECRIYFSSATTQNRGSIINDTSGTAIETGPEGGSRVTPVRFRETGNTELNYKTELGGAVNITNTTFLSGFVYLAPILETRTQTQSEAILSINYTPRDTNLRLAVAGGAGKVIELEFIATRSGGERIFGYSKVRLYQYHESDGDFRQLKVLDIENSSADIYQGFELGTDLSWHLSNAPATSTSGSTGSYFNIDIPVTLRPDNSGGGEIYVIATVKGPSRGNLYLGEINV